MTDHPHLTLVASSEHDQEFVPLPYYGWNERPPTLPLDPDECATAIHIARGHIPHAANLLKVAEFKLARMVRHHPRLARIQSEELELEVHKAAWEYSKALDSDNDRRREWGASKIMASKIAQSHPFAPAPPQPNAVSASVAMNAREIVFSWRQAAGPIIDGSVEKDNNGGDDAA